MAEADGHHTCYIAILASVTLFGILVNQIRTLQRLSWLAAVATLLGLIVIFITMGGVAKYSPMYLYTHVTQGVPADLKAKSYPPVAHHITPPSLGWEVKREGLMLIFDTFNGAVLYVEFMAEMRQPMHFRRSLISAQLVGLLACVLYGLVVYSVQGQYTLITSYVNYDNIALGNVATILNMILCLIAAAIQGNIGIKVLYNNGVKQFLKEPDMIALHNIKGCIIWAARVMIYWSFVFIFGAVGLRIMNVTSILNPISSTAFPYILPSALMIGFCIRNNMAGKYNAVTGSIQRNDDAIGFAQALWNRRYMYAVGLVLLLASTVIAILAFQDNLSTLKHNFSLASGPGSGFSCKLTF